MNVKTTLVLVVLLAIVAAYVFFIARDATPTYELEQAQRTATEERGEPLIDEAIEVEDVSRVTVRRGAESATFAKVDGGWRQVEPVNFPADAYKIDNLVREAVGLRWVDRVQAGKSNQPTKTELQLDPARATVTIVAGEKEHAIGVGRKSAGGRGYVTLGEGADVYVVNDALQTQLFTPERLTNWRRKSLEAPAATELDEVMIATPEGEVAAVKRDGRWYLGEGTGERAGEEAVAELVRNVGYLTARDFVERGTGSLGAYGLEQPRLAITLRQSPAEEGQEPRTSTLRIGNAADLKEETVYATWSQGAESPSTVVFTLPKSSVDRLQKDGDALRDKRLVAVKNAADVSGIELTRAEGDAVQLQRDGGAWRFAEPGPGFALDTAAANDLLDVLVSAEAERFEPAPADGSPAATVTLRVAGRDQPEVLRLYPASGESAETHWLSVREGERVAYATPKERLRKVFEPALALREKTVLEIPEDALTGLKLEQPEGATYEFTREEGQWALRQAAAFESADLERLVDELTRLRAESWVIDGRTPGDTPIVATLYLSGVMRTVRVDPQTRVGTLEGEAAAFVVPGHVVDLLQQEYRDRTALPWTIDQIDRVTLSSGDKTLTIHKGEDGQYVVEGGEEPADQAQAAAVFDTLAGLRVGRWLDAPADAGPEAIAVEVTPKEGEAQKLVVSPAADAGTLDSTRGFTLSDAQVAKIVAPIAPEEADKAEASEEDPMK